VILSGDAAARDTAITHTPEFVQFGVEYRAVIQQLLKWQCSLLSTSVFSRSSNTTAFLGRYSAPASN
jgi:hypothetical protein